MLGLSIRLGCIQVRDTTAKHCSNCQKLANRLLPDTGVLGPMPTTGEQVLRSGTCQIFRDLFIHRLPATRQHQGRHAGHNVQGRRPGRSLQPKATRRAQGFDVVGIQFPGRLTKGELGKLPIIGDVVQDCPLIEDRLHELKMSGRGGQILGQREATRFAKYQRPDQVRALYRGHHRRNRALGVRYDRTALVTVEEQIVDDYLRIGGKIRCDGLSDRIKTGQADKETIEAARQCVLGRPGSGTEGSTAVDENNPPGSTGCSSQKPGSVRFYLPRFYLPRNLSKPLGRFIADGSNS